MRFKKMWGKKKRNGEKMRDLKFMKKMKRIKVRDLKGIRKSFKMKWGKKNIKEWGNKVMEGIG